jgi:hypothetical protein
MRRGTIKLAGPDTSTTLYEFDVTVRGIEWYETTRLGVRVSPMRISNSWYEFTEAIAAEMGDAVRTHLGGHTYTNKHEERTQTRETP